MGVLLDAVEPPVKLFQNLVKSIGKVVVSVRTDWCAFELQGFIPHSEVRKPLEGNSHILPIRGDAGKLQPSAQIPRWCK